MGEGDKEWEKLADFYLVLASEDASKLQNMTAISNLCLFIIDNSYANAVKGGGDESHEIRITKRDGSDPDKAIVIESIEGVGLNIRVQDAKQTGECEGSKIDTNRITDQFVKTFKELGW